MFASLPSPSDGAIGIGPLQLRAYGLMIALGVLAGVKLASSRWEKRGGKAEDLTAVATWGVPAGLVGARLYHVATDYQRFQGRWLHAFAIWEGGLGIWGGVALGSLVGWWVARRRGLDATAMLDACAPAIPLAQAIGRIGNWFNQELYGRPTNLPWALEIEPSRRPDEYLDEPTFHPTFLYELLWCLGVVALVLWAERRWNLTRGRAFALYVAAYTVGRFWIEALRVDEARQILGLRLNNWTSLLVFLAAATFLVRRRPAAVPEPGLAGGRNGAPGEGATDEQPQGERPGRPEAQGEQQGAHGDDPPPTDRRASMP